MWITVVAAAITPAAPGGWRRARSPRSSQRSSLVWLGIGEAFVLAMASPTLISPPAPSSNDVDP